KPRRKDTKLPQTSVPTSVVHEAVNEEMDDSLERDATTSTSLDVEQDRGNISKTQSKETSNEPGSQGTSTCGGSRCQKAMGDTVAQTWVLDMETTKTNQAFEIDSLKRRVKKLKREGGQELMGLKDYTSTPDEQMFDVDQDLGREEVFVVQQDENVVEKEVDAAQV
nr:hypothetical protein [Tanacetum cinerariifolium]